MKCSISSARWRGGFTLLELLVVVAIIAVLAAMLFPAVQRLREMANRTRCVNNLHQLGMALSNHFGTQQSFPTNGAVIPSNGLIGPGTYYQFGLSSFPGVPPNYMWGMGNPSLAAKNQTGSWAYAILSYMEESSAFANPVNNPADPSNPGYSQTLNLFLCPTRGRGIQINPGTDAFWSTPWSFNQTWSPVAGAQATMALPNPKWGKTDYAGNYLMMPNFGTSDLRFFADSPRLGGARNYPITPSDISDGASNTILVGEKAMCTGAYNTGGWVWDESIFTGGSGGTSRGVPPSISPPNLPAAGGGPNSNQTVPFYSQNASPAFPSMPFYYPTMVVRDNDSNNDSFMTSGHFLFANNWGSAHPGGVNFLFADGSVRTFNYNVDPGLFQGLLTPAGSDPTPPES
jgi:prepilin-type N-terminal cleavage/methylation domain-containing protein/prepilin-type processing-associated H-X9-DG protein